jgi:hypothetical protein
MRKVLDNVTKRCVCDHKLLSINSDGTCSKTVQDGDDGLIIMGKILVGLNGICVIPLLFIGPFAFLQTFDYFQLFRHFLFINIEYPYASE